MKIGLAVLNLLCLAGCAANGGAPVSNNAPPVSQSDNVKTLAHNAAPPPADSPRDPTAAQQYVFQVDLYRLSVPFGTFSANEEFWKRIDEQCVDAPTYDILYKNGIRVGQAPHSELQHFKSFMENRPLMSKTTTTGFEAQRVELDMHPDLKEQTISVYDATNTLRMQDYDASSNVLNMAFSPTPRKPGQLRLSLCPMVRLQRKHYQTTLLNNAFSIQYIRPEMFYDLNLRVDISPEKFFIVMPSIEARHSTSVGRAFLTSDGPTDRLETILLIIPRPVAIGAPK